MSFGGILGTGPTSSKSFGKSVFLPEFLSDFQNTHLHPTRKSRAGDVYQSDVLQEGSNESNECSEPAPSGLGQWLINGQP